MKKAPAKMNKKSMAKMKKAPAKFNEKLGNSMYKHIKNRI